jgi:F-type H+-transporting ATPase subunit b
MDINASLIGQAITFAILVWVTMKLVWPPLVRALDERSKTIADGLAAAEKGKRELTLVEKRVAAEMDRAKQQAAEIVAQGEKRCAVMVEETKAKAKIEADRIIANAKAELDREVQRAKGELRAQVASLAVAGAEKILKRQVDQKAHADLLAALKARL